MLVVEADFDIGVADFLVIAPFARRNGRMSRLLTMLLLCKAGHAPVVCALTSVVMKKCQEVYAGALTAACGSADA